MWTLVRPDSSTSTGPAASPVWALASRAPQRRGGQDQVHPVAGTRRRVPSQSPPVRRGSVAVDVDDQGAIAVSNAHWVTQADRSPRPGPRASSTDAPARVKTPLPVSCQLIGNGLNARSWENSPVAPVSLRIRFHASGIRNAATPAIRRTGGRRHRPSTATRATARTADSAAPYSIWE